MRKLLSQPPAPANLTGEDCLAGLCSGHFALSNLSQLQAHLHGSTLSTLSTAFCFPNLFFSGSFFSLELANYSTFIAGDYEYNLYSFTKEKFDQVEMLT